MGGLQNPERVYRFLKKNKNDFLCDDCVAIGTKVDRHEVNTIGRSLALFPKEFVRLSVECSLRCSNRNKECTKAL